jgi:hypothetical protein
MRTLLVFLLSLSPILFFAQYKSGFYVTNTNDTVKCSILTQLDFWGKGLDYRALHGRLTIEEDGVKKKFKAHEIKSFEFYDSYATGSKKELVKFVSMPLDRKLFVRVLNEGEMSLYHVYSYHPYDKSYSPIEYIIKDGVTHKIIPISYKKIIERLISDNPAIYEKWKNGGYKKASTSDIVMDYNDSFLWH